MGQLQGVKVAVLATDGVEEPELTEPIKALREEGAQVDLLAPKPGAIQTFRRFEKGIAVNVDGELSNARPESYDALLLPGGALNADFMRMVPEARGFIAQFAEAEKPMAAICHAPWELISAGIVKDRKLSAYHTIQDDIRNAGGEWIDRDVVVDRNLVTSREPSDIPAFNREMIRLFSRAARPEPDVRLVEDRTTANYRQQMR